MRKNKRILAMEALQELSVAISEKQRVYQAYHEKLHQKYEAIPLKEEEDKLCQAFAQREQNGSVSFEDLREMSESVMLLRNTKYLYKLYAQFIDQLPDCLSRARTCMQTYGAPTDLVGFRKDLLKCKELMPVLNLAQTTLLEADAAALESDDDEKIATYIRKATDKELPALLSAMHELIGLLQKHYADRPEAKELLNIRID